MSTRVASVAGTLSSGNIAQAAETIMITIGPISPPLDGGQVMLFWYFGCIIGATWTNLGIRLRRGSALTSPLINVAVSEPVTPANSQMRGGVYIDNPGSAAGLFYSMSTLVTGGSGPGTVTDACLIALCL